MIRTCLTLFVLLLTSANTCLANSLKISPNNWWTKMQFNHLTLVVENVPSNITDITIINSPLSIIKHYPAANNNFHFIEIEIPFDSEPHTAYFNFTIENAPSISYAFTLYSREERRVQKALSSGDAIYQIIPDRFCNGNENNDNIERYFEKRDRVNPTGIHGGDLEGVISKLDYIDKLGCTALEVFPVSESNLVMNSYKNVASTNRYKIDERLGDIDIYKQLIDSCEAIGLKYIQVFTLHQIGNKHPYFQQVVDEDFFYHLEYDYNSSSPNFNLLTDKYIPESIKQNNRKLWNEFNYPTLNQDNELVRKLLIQNMIWWIETARLQNIKIDWAASNEPQFIGELYKQLKSEYNDLTIIIDNPSTQHQGEFWIETTKSIASFIVDYSFAKALSDAFSPYLDDGAGTQALYQHRIQSQGEHSSVIMLDNHMLNRAYTNADSEEEQYLMMLTYLLCSPGIPSIYYGTEWQMKGIKSKGISNLAKDFPGGWKEDEQSGFTGSNMSSSQVRFYGLFKKLLNWRKNNQDLMNGAFYHFSPSDDIYSFMRKSKEKTLLVIVNNSNNSSYRLEPDTYGNELSLYNKCHELITDNIYFNMSQITVNKKSIAVLELEK